MYKDDLEGVLIEAVARACNCDAQLLSSESLLEEIGLDSLGITSVIADVEEEFELQLEPDELMAFLQVKTIGDILQTFRSRGDATSYMVK
jgi:acyl carrier protein